jgi:hypothetical protein
MIGLLLGIVTAVLFSCLFLWAYRRGLKDGLALKDNKPIEPIKTPVQVIHERTEAKQVSEEEKTQSQFMTNLFGYDGNTQKEVKDA